ncbi:MAG: prolyl oligopeptidase family serine peptidase [Balneolaceae bacterium]|nr:prolyl oligopeptidase family serine peptidase [Balneolaceae bacterium]
MNNYTCTLLLALMLAPLAASGQSGLDTLDLRDIFYEPLLAGHRPDMAAFSPDGEWVYYTANDSAMSDNELFRVRLNGSGGEPAPGDLERGYQLSPQGDRLLYGSRGDIWLADLDFGNARRLVESSAPEYGAAWSPDGERIAYVQGGDIWVMNVNEPGLKQAAARSGDQPGYGLASWVGSSRLVLNQYMTDDYREYFFPEYVGHYVEPGSTRRGVATQVISVADLDSGGVTELARHKGYVSTSASADGRYLAVETIDPPMKQRTITMHDLQEGDSMVVFEESTEGWLYGTRMEFAPEGGNRLMIQSERDGWNHIYTILPDGSDMTQHTRGAFDIPWAEWTGPESMVFASTEVDPGERHIYTLDLEGDRIEQVTEMEGYRQSFDLSHDRRHVVYQYTFFNEPFELYAVDLQRPGRETRLTQTIPERFRAIDWQREDYLRFTGRDGETEISMSVLEPHNMQPGQKYPVVVFVHGAGSLQNVYKGWSNSYYREYMFHQMLNANGYYVMEVDYRHSTGYGRAFREDVTGWMGRYETHDIVDGIEHLAAGYAQADTSRVGVYGGSYGGFMALYAASVEPEYFDAAAALRAVTNWENYYHTNPGYTWPRLGTPEADSANYARSSPVTYAEELERPVLILHGLIDNNVGFQDAAQYIEELVQAGGKEFEMMMYPSERHSFQDPDAWHDEYYRIWQFFEEHLKGAKGY